MELSTKPSITPNGAMPGFLLRFGAFYKDKTVYVPFVFLRRIDILRSTHRGNCTFSCIILIKVDTLSKLVYY